jgi:hypothetical protein
VANYLAILGPEEFQNTLPHYLNTAMHRGAQLKMLYRAGFAPVDHTASKKHKTSRPACVFCGGCDDETATHFSLECPAFNSQRQPLLDDLSALVGSKGSQIWCCICFAGPRVRSRVFWMLVSCTTAARSAITAAPSEMPKAVHLAGPDPEFAVWIVKVQICNQPSTARGRRSAGWSGLTPCWGTRGRETALQLGMSGPSLTSSS